MRRPCPGAPEAPGIRAALWLVRGRCGQLRWEGRRPGTWPACRSGSSCAGCGPASAVTADAQDSEPGEVGSGGEQGEVGGDLELPADPGAAPAVAAAHEVADFALDLGPGCPVISPPGRARLGLAGCGQPGLVRADSDRAACLGGGAPGGQRAGAAGCAELGLPGVAVTAACPDGHGDARRAGDGLAVKIDGEAVLGEVTFHPGRG